jgi:uncharacterized membrane protein YraQ (UPF0718 family)
VDADYFLRIKDFILRFTGILYEALPWVVVGALFAGLVQELPPRRAPALMLALGLAILVLTVSPLPLLVNVGVAAAVAAATAGLMLSAQPLVDRFLAHLGRHRGQAIAMSGFLGLVNPMCDCGVIVVMRRLLRKGMPLSCCVTYILAGPIINVLVMATTYQAFRGQENVIDPRTGGPAFQMGSWPMMGFRIAVGYLVALGTGFIVERQWRLHGAKLLAPTVQLPSGLPVIELDEYGEHAPPKSLSRYLANISETALHDFVDVMVPLIIGALLAAGVQMVLDRNQIEALSANSPLVAIALLMLVGFLITLCSETDAFVIASFSLRPAAKLAFLVFGPMLDLKLFFMYTRVFRPRLMWTIIVSVALQVFVYCYIVHLLWENFAPRFWTAG